MTPLGQEKGGGVGWEKGKTKVEEGDWNGRYQRCIERFKERKTVVCFFFFVFFLDLLFLF